MSKSIVVVGSLNMDLVARVDRIPVRGETIIGLDFKTFPGGKGANQATAAALLGGSVKMIGKLGSDPFAAQLRNSMESAGVDASCVENVAGPSGTALIESSVDGENSIVVIPGANARLLPEDIDRYSAAIEQAALVLAQLEIPPETTEYLARKTCKAGVPFILDPAPAYPLSRDLLSQVTWLTPNETESLLLLGLDPGGESSLPVAETANRLLDMGVRNVILKLGARGVYLAGQDVEPVAVAGCEVKVVDTTGAGDAFNGAFAYALVHAAMPAREAAEFACGAAALSVTRPGAQSSMPGLRECELFLDECRALQP
ncbi:MAG TPA: ribokinase [Acidobacteriaceae bacterium]|nr:ribokinase [Acidobacteriaceae bacterium]